MIHSRSATRAAATIWPTSSTPSPRTGRSFRAAPAPSPRRFRTRSTWAPPGSHRACPRAITDGSAPRLRSGPAGRCATSSSAPTAAWSTMMPPSRRSASSCAVAEPWRCPGSDARSARMNKVPGGQGRSRGYLRVIARHESGHLLDLVTTNRRLGIRMLRFACAWLDSFATRLATTRRHARRSTTG